IRSLTSLIFLFFSVLLIAQPPKRPAYDWGAPRLVPVDVVIKKNKTVVKAGGEVFEFIGKLYALEGDLALTANWSKEDGDFTTLLLSISSDTEAVLQNVTWFAGRWE